MEMSTLPENIEQKQNSSSPEPPETFKEEAGSPLLAESNSKRNDTSNEFRENLGNDQFQFGEKSREKLEKRTPPRAR